MLRMERQRRQVDLVAGAHDLMHRRVGRFHLDDRLRLRDAAIELGGDLALLDPEGGGDALAAAGDGGDHFILLGARFLEEHRFRRLLDDRAHIGERDRLFVSLDLADLDKFFDERPQAEFLEIHAAPANAVHRKSSQILAPTLADEA